MRLVGLPEYLWQLQQEWQQSEYGQRVGVRFGQYVWNAYGQYGVDGSGWPELFYVESVEEASQMLINRQYY